MSEAKNPYFDKEIYDDIMSGTNIISGKEFKSIMCTISQMCSDLVVKTLGPYGSTTLLDDGMGAVYPTKDGWSVLTKLNLNNPIYNTALNTLRKTSFDAVTRAGDGTTTAMVAANSFLQHIVSLGLTDKPGFDQALFRKCVETAADDVINTLHRFATPIEQTTEGYNTIRQIALIATNGNEEFADMVKEVYEKTQNPSIHVQISNSTETKYSIENGYKVDVVPLMHSAYVNSDEGKAIIKNAKVLILNHNMTYVNHWDMLRVLIQYANNHKTTLIVMAPYFDDTISSWMVAQAMACQQKKTLPYIMFLQIPFTTELQKLAIEDLGIMTNATVIDDAKLRMFTAMLQQEWITTGQIPSDTRYDTAMAEMGHETYQNSEELILKCIGSIVNMEVTNKQLYLRDFEQVADTKRLEKARKIAEETWEHVNKKANRSGAGSIDKEYITAHQRYIRLRGKMGVIEVGGDTDLQKLCDKDSLDDACLACRSAWDNGYISGMGLDTLRITNAHYNYFNETLKVSPDPDALGNKYYKIALQAIYYAFYDVAKFVLTNKNSVSKTVKLPNVDEPVTFTNEEILTYSILGAIPVDGEAKYLHEDTYESRLFGDPDWEPNNGRVSFDLRRDMFIPIEDEDSIINSVEIDEGIIRTMVSVLTMVVTSNQFLSTGRLYDRKLTRSQTLQNITAEEEAKAKGYMPEIMRILGSPDADSFIQKLKRPESELIDEAKSSSIMNPLGSIFGGLLGGSQMHMEDLSGHTRTETLDEAGNRVIRVDGEVVEDYPND